jgi:hypothetical protein
MYHLELVFGHNVLNSKDYIDLFSQRCKRGSKKEFLKFVKLMIQYDNIYIFIYLLILFYLEYLNNKYNLINKFI